MNVWVLTIDHKHGTDIRVGATEHAARLELFEYVKEHWTDTCEKVPMPEDPELAVTFYFDDHGEHYILEEYPVSQREETERLIDSVETEFDLWRDPKTGLEWQVTPAPERMSLKDAKKYAKALDLDGGGWRLPTKDELVTISGTNRPKELRGANGWYWSSSPVEDDDDVAWDVYFSIGFVNYVDVANDYSVRCVR